MLNPLSTEALVAWLERRDPRDEYDWHDSEVCLFVQYARSLGMRPSSAHSHFFNHNLMHIAADRPWTVGAALSRARAVLEAEQQARAGETEQE